MYEQHQTMLHNLVNLFSVSLESLLALPCHVFWKSKDGVYNGYNDYGAKNLGYLNGSEIIGKTDYDIFPHDIANIFIENDHTVFRKKNQLLFQERGTLKNSFQVTFLSYKAPLYNEAKQLIGILGLSFIGVSDSKSSCSAAEKNSFITWPFSACQACQKRGTTDCPLLSEKEKRCLEYLCKGLTIKMIARQMGISPKTVDTYMERAKIKLNCQNKAQLILAFNKNYAS